MIMTSSQQQTSFLNTNGANSPLTPNSTITNPSPTISTFQPQQFQAQQFPQHPQPNNNPNMHQANANKSHPNSGPPNFMQPFHVSHQQQLQFLQAQYQQMSLRNQQMMNAQSFNMMPNMISPGTPSLPHVIHSPNVIPNVSTTPRQQFQHTISGFYHHNPYMTHHQAHHHDNNAALTPQQRPQTPITTIGATNAPSVASLTSFTPSMTSLGPQTILGMTAASGNFTGNNNQTHNQQHASELPHAQQTRFNPIGGGPNDNNNNNNNRNPNDSNNPNDDDGKQSNENMTDDNEPSAVLGQPPNSIIVNVSSNNKYGLRNYLVRARRILRLAKKCRICGIGSAVSVACEVTEVLKREKVAHVFSISTGLIEDEQSTRPTIEIVVRRGEFAHLVSDFRRRKVIEVFEKKDKLISGALSFDFVRRLDLATKFKADAYRTHQAQHYLQRLEGDSDIDSVTLPRFIHYCSIIIHPLLLEYHFKMAIAELGGYVDVHDGHLPREHTEEKVAQLQKLGRIDPFLKKGDDIEFNPEDFKHWFTDRYHHHHHHHSHRMDRQQQFSSQSQSHSHNERSLQSRSPATTRSMSSTQQQTAQYAQPHNVYNQYQEHTETQLQAHRMGIRAAHCPNYPNPMVSYGDVEIKNDTVTTQDSGGSMMGAADDNTTTNALDGSMITQEATVLDAAASTQDIAQKTDDPIPEDESITHDVDAFDNKEIINKMDNMTEEDDGSQVQPQSDASKPTTILSVNTEN